MEFEYESEPIAYEDYDQLDTFTVTDGSSSYTGGVADGDSIFVDEDGCIWSIDVLLTFNEIEIKVEVSQDSLDEFDYKWEDFDSGAAFEKWASEKGLSLRD